MSVSVFLQPQITGDFAAHRKQEHTTIKQLYEITLLSVCGDSIWQECYSLKSVYNGHAVRPTGGALEKHRGHTEISFTTSPTVHIICMHTIHQQREREVNLQ